jgi:alkanesulfonate monooxygenase SsuD/methylene tetrahydromethanopterin reductase-like flavin-dependent oxidoreductase (luciferase family)
MQLCLMIEGQDGVTWEEWVALAQACEAHGIETLLRSDHYQDLFGVHPEWGALDAWGTICGLAAVTRTLRLGTLVSPATFRHPSELAKLVTTADHISGGRVELGLGAGWNEAEHAAYGFELPPMRERIDLLAEQLEVIHGTWHSTPHAPFSHEGERYRLRSLGAVPGTVQRPHPPLIMGGSAAPRVAALAARFADEYNTNFVPVEEVARRRGAIAAACEAAGREPIPFSYMTGIVVAEDEAGVDARCARLEEQLGLGAGAVRGDDSDSFIVGTVEQVAERLRAYGEVGVTRVMCQHLLHDDLEMVAVLGERLAPLVA